MFFVHVLFLIIPVFGALELPRGVSLPRASFYQVGQPFKCLDGSGVVAWYQVNDDYCDCLDGSDEPGTSACVNGQFFCQDTQYKVVSLRSSFVNDGVCDCCDGSDEYAGRVTCESTCGSLAAAVEQARSLKRKEIERGHSIFKEYVTKLKVRREEERIAAEQAERERQLKAEEAEEPSESQVTPPSQTPPEPHSEQSVEVPLEPQSSESSKSSEFEAPATEDHVERDVPLEHEDETHQEEGHQSENTEGYHNDESSPPPPKPEPVTEPPKPIDYGPEEAFYMLKDLPECLEYMDPQYTYRFCAFKDIHQRDKGSTSDGTLLGKWSGWATEQEDAPAEQKYSLMKFTDGWGCWNGPARSVKVHVHCSDENKITDVKEPSRCEYEMQLYTPAACYQDPEVLLERLQEEL
ncbi:Glucosidase 2 subunit beta [Clonorchis sinensis]|uniref:Glucosidase 2 subunit beta n=1 Tax=Clonorchis sinensis TaxID=79923 RepID=A0A8T1MJ77_CLOSI|nr:Glucosidase 2 subunit beta [Clonorchis sinensis]